MRNEDTLNPISFSHKVKKSYIKLISCLGGSYLFNIFKRNTKIITLESLKKTVVGEMKKFTIETVKLYSEEKGKICFIAYEYFYDGEVIDIGLRVGLDEERQLLEESYENETDVRKHTGDFSFYKPMLREESCKKNANSLFNCMRLAEKYSNGSVYKTIQEISNSLTEEVKDVLWYEYATISSDFIVLDPFAYD